MGDSAASRWINRVLLFIVFFIGLHTLFVLFDGNRSNGIVQFVGAVARLFLLPFRGIVANQNRLLTSLIAVLAYSLVAGVLMTLVKRLGGGQSTQAQADVDTTRRG